jgi:molybdate transport system ATP-binding protein
VSDTGRGLDVRLNHRVHDALALEVAFSIANECVVLFGASGAGKSTILRIIAGLILPDQALVRVANSILADTRGGIRLPLRARHVGLIGQDDLLFPHLDVERNVKYGLGRWPSSEVDARFKSVAALCGIEHLARRSPRSLSGGERQRVGLARALAPRPQVLLCDEPFSALDVEARRELVVRLRAVQRSESIPILFVTHSPEEAIALGDRVLFLEQGRIAADGLPLEVLAARGPRDSFHLQNTFQARIERQEDDRSTLLQVAGGPSLSVARFDAPAGTSVVVEVGADEIVLARGPIGLVSARNLVVGVVERVISHGFDAEALVRTGKVSWVVGVTASSVMSLGLIEGVEVRMIIKARSCRVRFAPGISR